MSAWIGRAAGYAVLALWQVNLRPTSLESFWPTSLLTWIAVVSFLITAADYWTRRRKETEERRKDSAEARKKALADALAPLAKDLAAVEVRAMGKVEEAVTHFDASLEELSTLSEHRLDAFGQAIRVEVNGLGERVRRTEAGQHEQDGFNDRVIEFMATSQQDRRTMNEKLTRLEKWTEDQTLRAAESERRILDAINRKGRP